MNCCVLPRRRLVSWHFSKSTSDETYLAKLGAELKGLTGAQHCLQSATSLARGRNPELIHRPCSHLVRPAYVRIQACLKRSCYVAGRIRLSKSRFSSMRVVSPHTKPVMFCACAMVGEKLNLASWVLACGTDLFMSGTRKCFC